MAWCSSRNCRRQKPRDVLLFPRIDSKQALEGKYNPAAGKIDRQAADEDDEEQRKMQDSHDQLVQAAPVLRIMQPWRREVLTECRLQAELAPFVMFEPEIGLVEQHHDARAHDQHTHPSDGLGQLIDQESHSGTMAR